MVLACMTIGAMIGPVRIFLQQHHAHVAVQLNCGMNTNASLPPLGKTNAQWCSCQHEEYCHTRKTRKETHNPGNTVEFDIRQAVEA
jgi:hypothetical protein